MNLQTIKRKYFFETDKEIAIGKADEIRWLITELEKVNEQLQIANDKTSELVEVLGQQRIEYATLSESIAENDTIINQLQQEVEQYKLQESLLLERLQKQTLQLKEMKQNSRLQSFYSMAEENLKLAQENARLKESVKV